MSEPVKASGEEYVPQTPSPFLHPSDPSGPGFLPMSMDGNGYEMYDPLEGALMPIAFGDFAPEQPGCMSNFEFGDDGQGMYCPTLQYDPNTGAFFCVDPCYGQMPMDASCYGGVIIPEMLTGNGCEMIA